MKECRLCPRQCGADRTTPQGLKRSLCKAGAEVEVALSNLHKWEEPCISGKTGAGTVFFSHCHMRCCFCQNYEISAQGKGWKVSAEELATIFLKQQEAGASVLELVSPTHYAPQIRWALETAKANGLAIPVAYNSNGYETVEAVESFKGLVDIWMPDLKYFDSKKGACYSGIPHYFEIASKAIKAMFSQTAPLSFNESGILQSGLVIRHLVLPGSWRDSIKCMDWIWDNFGDKVFLSLMNQYMPLYKACKHPEINRPLMTLEYQKVLRHARELGIKNGFMQLGRTDSAKFIPVFDGSGVIESANEAPTCD